MPSGLAYLSFAPTNKVIRGNHTDEKDFKVGDHVEWNSEAGRVRGTIMKKVTSAITFKGYTVRASKEEPQYLIKRIMPIV
jgi:hypothetical protein